MLSLSRRSRVEGPKVIRRWDARKSNEQQARSSPEF